MDQIDDELSTSEELEGYLTNSNVIPSRVNANTYVHLISHGIVRNFISSSSTTLKICSRSDACFVNFCKLNVKLQYCRKL